MKNIIRILGVTILISILWILPSNAQDNTPQTTASLSVKENMVTIKGNTNTRGYTEISLYVTNPHNQPTHAEQTLSEYDGSFSFVFPMEYNIIDGTYKAYIGRGDSDEKKVIWFNYPQFENSDDVVDPNASNEMIIDNLFLSVDLEVTISQYVPTIDAIINCAPGTSMYLCVANDTDNTIIDERTITSDYEAQAYYTLPSLRNNKNYEITISASDNKGEKVATTLNIDTSLLLVDIEGILHVGDNEYLEMSLNSSNSNLIEKNITINEDRTFSLKIPNIMANSTYTMNVKGHTFYNEDSVKEIIKSYNYTLYNALRNERPSLDSNGDGIITQEELNSITGVLDLSGKNIEVLAGLGECKNVTGLILRNNKIKSLRPLSNMTGLEYVDAQNNEITNISTMPQNLRYLDISNNQVTGLQGLKNADKLEYLSASYNKINTISGIGDKKKPRYLNLYDNQIKNAWTLIGCNRLVYANLGKNNIESIAFLNKLQNIHYINLKENN